MPFKIVLISLGKLFGFDDQRILRTLVFGTLTADFLRTKLGFFSETEGETLSRRKNVSQIASQWLLAIYGPTSGFGMKGRICWDQK